MPKLETEDIHPDEGSVAFLRSDDRSFDDEVPEALENPSIEIPVREWEVP